MFERASVSKKTSCSKTKVVPNMRNTLVYDRSALKSVMRRATFGPSFSFSSPTEPATNGPGKYTDSCPLSQLGQLFQSIICCQTVPAGAETVMVCSQIFNRHQN